MSTFDFTAGLPAPDDARLVASYDTAGSYEVDEAQVYLLADNRFYMREASGCSCWDGEYNSAVYDSLRDWVTMGAGGRWTDFTSESEFADFKRLGEEFRREAP